LIDEQRAGSRAEDDVVVGAAGAGVGAGGVVLGVAVRVGALALEELGVVGGPAGVLGRPGAAVPVLLEHGARVVAAAGHPELGRALRRDVGAAPRPALGAPAGGQEVHGHVEAVHEGDVEEVEAHVLVQPELGERVGRLPVPRALQHPAAVARRAVALAAAVERAPRARPHAPARRAGRHVDLPRLAVLQLLAAARWHGRGPHGELAVVGDGEGGRVRGAGDGQEEEREEAQDGSHHFCPLNFFAV
jgi:hypothetical protein